MLRPVSVVIAASPRVPRAARSSGDWAPMQERSLERGFSAASQPPAAARRRPGDPVPARLTAHPQPRPVGVPRQPMTKGVIH